MKTSLVLALCLCLLTFGPQGGLGLSGVGAASSETKLNGCLNTAADGSSSGNTACTSSSSDKSGFPSEESFSYEETAEDSEDEPSVDNGHFPRNVRLAPTNQFTRFGRDHKFLRFGRDVGHKFLRFGRQLGDGGEQQLPHMFIRFGRGFEDGVSGHKFLRFGKADGGGHKFLRFGKKSSNDADIEDDGDYFEEDVANGSVEAEDEDTDERFGRVAKDGHKFLRFGRTPQSKGHSFFRFGRTSKTLPNFMRFGRIPEHKFLRFGRSSPQMAPQLQAPSSAPLADSDAVSLPASLQLLGDSTSNMAAAKRDGHKFFRFGRK